MIRKSGLALAGVTALVSGISVYVNGDAVRRFDDATAYTTLKNLVAGLVILAAGALTTRGESVKRSAGARWRLVVIAVIGGAVPFVLFFEGLQRAGSSDAAFLHKTLVAWVAIGATAVLRERIGPLHLAAIGLVLWGQAELAGGVGLPERGSGEAMILAATLCWAVEVIIAKRLLDEVAPLIVARARMVGGSVALVGWCVVSGRAADLVDLDTARVSWLLLTGVLLAAYVLTWCHALAWAPAVDVTAVLVGGAVITAVLDGAFRNVDLSARAPGVMLIGAGVLAIFAAAIARPAPEMRT
ncbi:MAG: DMT family transporter [Acidimicrobiales bacterium]|nr:DMT family transporter [Acidimicrobiales bacterium]